MVYNREELFDKIDRLKIEKIGSSVITKYNDEVIKTANVSKIYEVFDIVKYLKDNILNIEKNFEIKEYGLRIRGGIQYVQLHSDIIIIDGRRYQKTFHMLNSTDKSRRLSFNTGLYCLDENFYLIMGVENVSISKRHTTGVTEHAEIASKGLNDETFDEQIDALESLVNQKVAYSKIRELILGDSEHIKKIDHKKFNSFRNEIYWNIYKDLSDDNKRLLRTRSEYLKKVDQKDDFYIDAFLVVRSYLKIFKKDESNIIKNESEKIMKITQSSIRNNILEMLGI